jgi:hypothetical protein
MADLYGMEFALDVVAPEIEKPAQLGKIRGKIELLPDEALQQVGMIGKMVDDLRGSQPILAKWWPGIAHWYLLLFALANEEDACTLSLWQQKSKL